MDKVYKKVEMGVVKSPHSRRGISCDPTTRGAKSAHRKTKKDIESASFVYDRKGEQNVCADYI